MWSIMISLFYFKGLFDVSQFTTTNIPIICDSFIVSSSSLDFPHHFKFIVKDIISKKY